MTLPPMNMITVQELARVLAERKKLEESVARSFVSTMFDVVRVALERDKLVKVKGLGTFKLIEVSARESVNVNSGERMLIGSYGKITFTPDSIMKEIVNKPFSQFETVVLNDGVEFDDIEQQGGEPVPEPAVETDGDISEGYADSDAEQEAEPAAEIYTEPDAGDGSGMNDNAANGHGQEGSSSEPDGGLAGPAAGNGGSSGPDAADAEAGPEATGATSVAGPSVGAVTDAGDKHAAAVSLENHAQPAAVSVAGPDAGQSSASDAEAQAEADAGETVIPAVDRVEESAGRTGISPSSPTACAEKADDGEAVPEPEAGARGRGVRAAMLSLLVVVLMAASAYGGYLFGLYKAYGPALAKDGGRGQTATQAKPAEQPVKSVQPAATADSAAAKAAPADTATAVPPAGKAAAPAEKAAGNDEGGKARPAEAKAFDPAKYDAMDSRVRTGAYRIVGTDRVVRVKQGESLQRISDRMLGPGMECYIEVYNGLPANADLKEGQALKIPKLELRKKRR